MASLHATSSRNEEYRIQDLVRLVQSGTIRIPEFQRAYRWEPADVLALFDSILRGYPFGSLLLWRKPAPAARLTIGAIAVTAPKIEDALWVVDGQQRITSLVNAVDPRASQDERFAIAYSLDRHRFVLSRDARADRTIPLPDLFDLGRAFGWLQANPDAADSAEEIQRVTGLLRDVIVPASVIAETDENVLREIFDRINAAGRRLRGSEIFDAIHGASAAGNTDRISIPSIADRLDAETGFGRLPDQTVYQAILVIRHPDLTRNVRSEFSPERDLELAFGDENQSAAYARGEEALTATIRFLQNSAGVPHSSFVPFRFHLLVLARFFAHFPDPSPRNLELLGRWVWRSTAMASRLGFTGSTGNIRQLAGLVQPGSESGSVQRLLDATQATSPVPVPAPETFRTNNSSGKIMLAALWSLGPVNPLTNEVTTVAELAEAIGEDTSPKGVALALLPRGPARDAANRVLTPLARDTFLSSLRIEHMASHLLTADLLDRLESGSASALVERRTLVRDVVARFLAQRTGVNLEQTAPLADFDLDDLDAMEDASDDDDLMAHDAAVLAEVLRETDRD